MRLINCAKLRTALIAVATVLVTGWVACTTYKLQRAEDERVRMLEHNVASLSLENKRVAELADQIAKGVDVLSGRAPVEIYLEYIDSVQALQIRQREATATMRFVMSDSSVVRGPGLTCRIEYGTSAVRSRCGSLIARKSSSRRRGAPAQAGGRLVLHVVLLPACSTELSAAELPVIPDAGPLWVCVCFDATHTWI